MGVKPLQQTKPGAVLRPDMPLQRQMMSITKKCLTCGTFCDFTGVQELQPDTWAVLRFVCGTCQRVYDAYLSDGVPTEAPSDPDEPALSLLTRKPHDRLEALEL